MHRYASLVVLGLGLAAATDADAQDLTIYGGAALVYSIEPDGPGTGNRLAFQPYIEAEASGFYAGLWLSLADESVANEVDIYLGYRNETATGMTYDFGYTRYYYPNDGGNCCGELTVALGTSVGDKLSLAVEAAYDPEASIGTASIGADYALTDVFSLGAAVGVTDNGNEQEWEFGGSYYVTDEAYIDLHYYEGSDYDGYVELTLSFDTTLFQR